MQEFVMWWNLVVNLLMTPVLIKMAWDWYKRAKYWKQLEKEWKELFPDEQG